MSFLYLQNFGNLISALILLLHKNMQGTCKCMYDKYTTLTLHEDVAIITVKMACNK